MKGYLVVAVICLAIGFISVDGLQCYNCLYVDSRLPPGINLTMLSDPSCKRGSTPKSKFSVDCSNLTQDFIPGFESSSLTALGVNVLYPKSTVPTAYTCAKLDFDGRFNARYGSQPFRGVIRTCVPSHREIIFEEACHNGTLEHVTGNVTDMETRTVLRNYENVFNATETNVTVCTCHKDKNCNGGMTSAVALPGMVLLGVVGMMTKGFW
ncbi:unnamed protein product [Orchesella dallaii]|uniref:Protein sleepless n=1 Tax=Orchesella dallaii TaxID=48710 RepID=A0ABP1PSB8_9HEXA